MITLAATETVRSLPTVECPDLVLAGDLLAVVGPEDQPGIVGADFGAGALFVTMTASEARALSRAFLRAAVAAEHATP